MRHNSHKMPAAPSGRGKVFRNSRFGGGKRRQGRYINPDKFVSKAAGAKPNRFVAQHSFSDFGLSRQLQQNLNTKGYSQPTAIQDASIKPGMSGRDLIGLANTGTGKTAAFLIPIIHRLQSEPKIRRVLIMTPTRELAVQINQEFRAFAAKAPLYSALCVGGMNINRQIHELRRQPQVVIGTPGRLKDLVQQKALKLDNASILVLDEADRMLDMGFSRDINFLVGLLPKQRQTLCFTATLTNDIEILIRRLLNDPVTVSVKTSQTSDHVDQDVIEAVSKDDKFVILKDLLNQAEYEKVLVFGQTKWGVQKLAERLAKEGVSAQAIHGNKSQSQRQRTLDAFKADRVRVLVATDVAARGLDIPHVSHVINFDQPSTYEDYIHRIGRTARAGLPGKALTFVSNR